MWSSIRPLSCEATSSVTAAFEPARPSHAIEVMAWAIEWSDGLSPETMAAMLSHYDGSEHLKSTLPQKRDIPLLRISFDGGKTPSGPSATTSNGADFAQFQRDGSIAWAVSLRQQFISCNCGVYDRWASTKDEAYRLLAGFVEIALKRKATIKVVGLQYQDAFYCKGKAVDVNEVRRVVRLPNPWLPEAALNHPYLWHVHQGWFSTSPTKARVLNKLNIDLREEGDKIALRIDGQHRSDMSFADADPNNKGSTEFDGAVGEWEHLHASNRRLLDCLLTDDMLARINAQKGKY
jgi:uncharacterized protein (TIGR04255 family)